jgi:hypothetical protein
MCVETLDPNEIFGQDRRTGCVLPDLKNHARDLRRRKHSIGLSMQMDNSHCHNGQKSADKMRRKDMIRFDHPPHSIKQQVVQDQPM